MLAILGNVTTGNKLVFGPFQDWNRAKDLLDKRILLHRGEALEHWTGLRTDLLMRRIGEAIDA